MSGRFCRRLIKKVKDKVEMNSPKFARELTEVTDYCHLQAYVYTIRVSYCSNLKNTTCTQSFASSTQH